MQGQKSHIENPHGGGWFSWELKILGLFLALISFSFNFIFSDNTSALFVPTLSASVDNPAVSVNGNQVINSTDKTTEIPFNFTVNTNNRTGYTATLSAETENTALTNAGSSAGAKIDSISTNLTLNNLPNNTWGYKFGSSTNYAPIPALSTPAQIVQTTGKTNGNESNQLSIGMKLADNLESGNYTNKLILSFVSNPYERRAVMTTGKDFNRKVDSIVTSVSNDDGWGNKESVNHILRSTAAFNDIPAGAIDVESDETSDYPIKIWYDTASKTVFYWTESNKIFLNKDSRYTFRGFTKTEDIDISNFDSSEVEDMAYFFYKMNSLQSLNLNSFNTNKTTDMTGMFAYVNSLKKLDLTNFNTSKVTNMSAMFHSMSNLDELKISSFNTENVANMNGMFYGASKIASLELSNFDTSNVTDMGRMFSGMSSIQQLDLSHFNTASVTAMNDMFSLMISLTQINFGTNFDTSNVTDMTGMFYQSTSLVNLDLSHFNTRKVKSMISMFSQMSGLTILDISNFETPSLENAGSMFAIDPGFSDNLEKIYVNQDFDTSKLTTSTNAFIRRNRLRGGNGSYLSDPSTADKTWFRVDRPGVQGYFTRKS